jgi:hypothetical protein
MPPAQVPDRIGCLEAMAAPRVNPTWEHGLKSVDLRPSLRHRSDCDRLRGSTVARWRSGFKTVGACCLANFDSVLAAAALLLITLAAMRLRDHFIGLRREIDRLQANAADLRQIVELLQISITAL